MQSRFVVKICMLKNHVSRKDNHPPTDDPWNYVRPHDAKIHAPRPTKPIMRLVILSEDALFCKPGSLPVVAAAPAAPVASGLSVTGALTTTTEVEVLTVPSGAVV